MCERWAQGRFPAASGGRHSLGCWRIDARCQLRLRSLALLKGVFRLVNSPKALADCIGCLRCGCQAATPQLPGPSVSNTICC